MDKLYDYPRNSYCQIGRGSNKPALGNPLPALSRSRRVATNLNLKRRGAPGSGLPGLDVRQESTL